MIRLASSSDEPHFLVVGVGGLGCPALLGLAAGGAKHITLVDHDHVERSNLQRQVLFTTADIGLPKVDVARLALNQRFPDILLQTIQQKLLPPSVSQMPQKERLHQRGQRALPDLLASFSKPPILLECTDQPLLKFAWNDLCVERNICAVIAGAQAWKGQIFALAPDPDKPCFRCIFESPPEPQQTQTCMQAGIMGAVVGFLGYWMAQMALALGRGERHLAGNLISVNTLNWQVQRLRPKPRQECSTCAHKPS